MLPEGRRRETAASVCRRAELVWEGVGGEAPHAGETSSCGPLRGQRFRLPPLPCGPRCRALGIPGTRLKHSARPEGVVRIHKALFQVRFRVVRR